MIQLISILRKAACLIFIKKKAHSCKRIGFVAALLSPDSLNSPGSGELTLAAYRPCLTGRQAYQTLEGVALSMTRSVTDTLRFLSCHVLWPYQDSNLDLKFRKLLFYPLNYKAVFIICVKNKKPLDLVALFAPQTGLEPVTL